MNVVRTQGQLETVEVWPGGPRTRINRHDLVRKLVVRPLRLEKHDDPSNCLLVLFWTRIKPFHLLAIITAHYATCRCTNKISYHQLSSSLF